MADGSHNSHEYPKESEEKKKKNENRMRGICLGKVGWEESQKKRVTECKLNVWEGVNSSFKSKPT